MFNILLLLFIIKVEWFLMQFEGRIKVRVTTTEGAGKLGQLKCTGKNLKTNIASNSLL